MHVRSDVTASSEIHNSESEWRLNSTTVFPMLQPSENNSRGLLHQVQLREDLTRSFTASSLSDFPPTTHFMPGIDGQSQGTPLLPNTQYTPAPDGLQNLGFSRDFSSLIDIPWQPSASNNFAASTSVELPYLSLPLNHQLIELFELFFLHFYPLLPCFHKTTLLDEVKSQEIQKQAPFLVYAIISMTAKFHPDPTIQACRDEWFNQAKALYELTQRDTLPGLRVIQAGICIVFHASTLGQFSPAWLSLGKTWRQACALSLNRLDDETGGGLGLGPPPKSNLEREEYRRTLWSLFILDRSQCWPSGWPHGINDRQYLVNLPIEERKFQSVVMLTSDDAQSTPFNRNLSKLIASPCTRAGSVDLFQCLVKGYVILGRVVEHVHNLHNSPDDEEYCHESNYLDSQIIRFRLSLPRAATSILAAPTDDRLHVVWLNVMLNTVTILLHFRATVLKPSSLEAENSEENMHFAQCVAAARNTIQFIKDMSRISLDPLFNPLIGPDYYLLSCVLVIEWRQTGDDNVKSEIDMLDLFFDRLYEVYPFLGKKFKVGLRYDLQRDKDGLREMRKMGARGLLTDCSKWKRLLTQDGRIRQDAFPLTQIQDLEANMRLT
ncbi:hypothetical protein AOQ84DRAFT_384756 [Glonium stellatum]|uniref:Xylanolytic transcriptional activator regulatory domain-containing protein n=1 Tax=Glonium stellatum TaxID=574774 RepID=A0A8E2FC04_9PEZI|nr:hypothetical protein AOQ84DRAFT_384756 [Glonium stellatum]